MQSDYQRMWDLCRQMRTRLSDEDLISMEEYAQLAEDHPAVKRLESYDEMRQRIAALEAENAALSAQLAEAREDTGRLDYLIQGDGNCAIFVRSTKDLDQFQRNPRAAIDAARKAVKNA